MTQIKFNYVYEILLLLLKSDMHVRDLVKTLNTSLTRVQTILAELRECNVLDYKEQGKNHVYFIKKNLVSNSFVKNAENYKLAKLLSKYKTLESLFKDILEICPDKLIILFGSYAKFIPKSDSDIDIFIETTDKKIKTKIEQINSSLSVKIGELNLNDSLIQEIINAHIIIKGTETYYDRIGFFKEIKN